MTIEVRAVPWDHPDGVALREAQRVEVREVYYPDMEESEPGTPPSAADMIAYFVAFDGGRAIGTGGLRAIDDEHGEIKRMYVDPEYRGSGVASLILHTLEDDARARGWSRLVLETGDRMLPAQRFYLREGFSRIPQFGSYAGVDLSVCYGKSLD